MSYYAALELEREPFSTSPDPSFLYQSKQHRTALHKLEIAVRLKRGMSVILGDVGTGKTTLSRALIQAFENENDYIFHLVLDPEFKTEHEFLEHLAKLFGLSPFFRSTSDYRDVIEKHLFRQCVEQKKTIVLIVDEGQKLSLSFLEILRTLLNYETNDQKLLQLVIFGQLEMLPKLQGVKNLVDRIATKYILQPLDEAGTREMISFRLQQAGHQGFRALFTDEAVRMIYEYTQGYPRRIGMICHQAMEELSVSHLTSVDGGLIARIIENDQAWR